jgi:ribosomal protein L37AE/L43A
LNTSLYRRQKLEIRLVSRFLERFERTIEFTKNKRMNCYLCKKFLTDVNGYQVGTVWSCEKCLDIVKQLADENRIKNED